MKLVSCKSALNLPVVYSTDHSKAVVQVLVLLFGEERANLSAFRMFVRFALVWFCLFPLPLGVWKGLQFVIVALPGHFS